MKAYPYMHKHPTSGQTTMSDGMDLRDWFAGLAMQGVISNLEEIFTPEEFNGLSEMFYQMADAMIKARNNRKEVPNE
jgi:hypothetical protein